jgi:hypothetical protein
MVPSEMKPEQSQQLDIIPKVLLLLKTFEEP